MSDALKKLQSHAEQKRLFHGSPVSGLKLLEPRPATDTDKTNTFNNDTAVFASGDFTMSIIFGVVDIGRLPRNRDCTSWSINGRSEGGITRIVARMPAQWRPHIEVAPAGCVYVFSRETFLETDGLQWKSKVAVAPVDCVAVTVHDFRAAGGILEWA
jgi:hypothetical protein